MNKDNTPLNRWKPVFYKKDVIDIILDLFFDIRVHLNRSKHIQNFKNAFKRKPVKEHPRYLELHHKNIFEEIKIQEIKEIKFEKEIQVQNKKSKQKTTITQKTEPSVEDVVNALSVKIDYRTAIINFFVNVLMLIPIIILGTIEVFKFLGIRLWKYLKLIATLPFRQVFSIAFRFSIVIVCIGISIFLFNYFRSVSTAQQISNERMDKLENQQKKEYDTLNNRFDNLKQEFDKLKATSVIVEHKLVEREYVDRFGNVIKREKLR